MSVTTSPSNRISAIYGSPTFSILVGSCAFAFLAGFRIATNGDAVGDEMFREWMIDWMIIWAALAIVALSMLRPLFQWVAGENQSYRDKQLFDALSHLEPAMAQELRAMEIQQQYRDEMAVEAQAQRVEALEALGGTRLAPRRERRYSDALKTSQA